MKKIEIRLNPAAVAPLLDLVRRTAEELEGRLVGTPGVADADEELRVAWRGDLLQEQQGEMRQLLALFGGEFLSTGVLSCDEENAEPVLRACAAVRLRLRERELAAIPDEELEGGEVDERKLEPAAAQAFVAHGFLAALQELMIRQLEGGTAGEAGPAL
jgi:hypothetical protein